MRQKQKKTIKLFIKRGLTTRKSLIAVASLLCLCLLIAPLVGADSIQQQISNLNNENNQSQSSISSLQLQATSYQDAISKLQVQVNAIQSAVAASQAQQAQLQQQIQSAQNELNTEKQILGSDIKAIYVNGQMTTIEELATSKNLSDFVDAETYRNAVETQIQTTLVKVSELDDQLKDQKDTVDQLLQTQQAQQAQLNNDQQQQQQLLSYNQQQQDQYNQQIATNEAQISQLEAEQASINSDYAENVHVPPGNGSGGACDIGQGTGGYPWCNASFTFNYSPNDPNGFPERQCTSFAYWYFTSIEGNSLTVSGNAGDWWYTANRPVDQTPQVGAIGVEPSNEPPHYSPYGHVMIVLALPGTTYNGSMPYTSNAAGVSVPAGDVLVMSMNENEEGDFMYNLWPANTLYYIH